MEVIKIEPPGGDPVRNLAPFIKSADGKSLSTAFAHLNAGKASKVVDLTNEAGKAAFRELVKSADVVIESFQPGRTGRQGTRLQRSRGDQSGNCHGVDHRFWPDRSEEKFRLQRFGRARRERLFIYCRRSVVAAVPAAGDPGVLFRQLVRYGGVAGGAVSARAHRSGRSRRLVRCRKLWRPKSISFACGPTSSRLPNAPAASTVRWRRRKSSPAATATFIFT